MTPKVRPFGALLRMLVLLMGLLLVSQAANAACASPSGNVGDQIYASNYNTMVFCDGSRWVSMAGGVSVTVNTTGGGATPAGSSADVQFNSAGALAADTGNFTYASGLLKAPNISATAITASGAGSFGTINSTGLGTLGSLIVTGGATITGQASITTISTSLIQIGNNGAACTASLAGAQRYNSVSNTMDYCTGSAWLSLGPSATTVPAFSVNKNGTNQTVTAGTSTLLTWSNKLFDTNNNFDTGTNRFTPTIPGKYLITLNVGFTSAAVSDYISAQIRKNGSLIKQTTTEATAASQGLQTHVTAIVDMNGTSDYIEGWGGTNLTTIKGTVGITGIDGILISMAGGGSGDTANPAGSTNDVQFNSGGLLAADTGKFTYTSGVLSAPAISATAISTTVANFASATSYVNVLGGLGNMISSGSAVVSTSSAGSITFFVGGNQRMLVNGNGVSIGSAAPNAQLLVRTDTTDYARIRVANMDAAGGSGYYFGTDADPAYSAFIIANNTNNTSFAGAKSVNMVNAVGPLAFFASTGGAVERMRIDTSGYVGVGTTNPQTSPNPGVNIQPIGAIAIGNNAGASGSWFAGFYRSGTPIGSIAQNGTTAVAYNTTSDRRVKENITDTREGLQKLMQLPVRDFQFRKDPSHTIVTGFIAQELDKVFPEAVTTNGDNGETKLTSGTAPWSVDYGRVTPLIVKSVQDLKMLRDADIASLTTQLKAANDNIRELRLEIDQLKKVVGR